MRESDFGDWNEARRVIGIPPATEGRSQGMAAEPFSLSGTRQLTPLVSPAPSVTLSSSANRVEPGQDVTVTADVANPSPDLSADQASVTLNLPAGLELVSGDRTQQLDSLSRQGQPGDTAAVSWVVRATQPGIYSISAATGAEHCGEEFWDQGATAVSGQAAGGGGIVPPAPPTLPGPGQSVPAGPSQPRPPLAAAHLRVRKAWSSKGLRLSGSLARGATGRVTVTYTVRRRGVVRRASVHGGRFAVLIRDRRAHRRTLTVRYSGDRKHRGQTVRVRV